MLLLRYPCYLVKSINKVRLNLMWCVYVCSYTHTYTFYLLRSMGHIHGWLGMNEYSCVWGDQKTLLLSFSHCGETRQCLLLNQEHICSDTLASQQALGNLLASIFKCWGYRQIQPFLTVTYTFYIIAGDSNQALRSLWS